MPELSALFPEDRRRALVAKSLVPGAVLYLWCAFTTPPKQKYMVLLTVDDPPILFLINSELGEFILRRPHLLPYQIPLSPSANTYLDHPSYLDCARPITGMTLREITEELVVDTSGLKGQLDRTSRQEVRRLVLTSRSLTPGQIRAIRQALS